MTIPHIASEVNQRSKNYRIGDLQEMRKQIKGLAKKASSDIFHSDSTSDKWAFHYGGRKEIQYNISFEDEGLRYGLAFSLETSRSLPSLDILYPKIRKFNSMVKEDPVLFADYKMWTWRGDERSRIGSVKPIRSRLVENGTFIFIGKLMAPDNIDYDQILKTFDFLLPIYLEIETEPKVITTSFSIFQFNNQTRNLPGATKYTSREKEINIAARHSFLQEKLYQNLVQLFGEDQVGLENEINGNRIDIVVKKSDKEFVFYEVKTGSSARSCVRQGLGQLLEYAYWDNDDLDLTLIIAGEWEIDKKTNRYIRYLESEFNLPIRYVTIK